VRAYASLATAVTAALDMSGVWGINASINLKNMPVEFHGIGLWREERWLGT